MQGSLTQTCAGNIPQLLVPKPHLLQLVTLLAGSRMAPEMGGASVQTLRAVPLPLLYLL